MKVCLKAPLSKNLHHAETRQLTLIECQMSGLHMTQGITDRSLRKDLKITKMLKFVKKKTFKFLKSLLKGLFRGDIFMKDLFTDK